MKKIHLFIFSFIFAIALSLAIFGCTNLTDTETQISLAETQEQTQEETNAKKITGLFDYIALTQDGKVFKEEDFMITRLPGSSQDYYTIYTNKTISLSVVYEMKLYDTFSMAVNNTIKSKDSTINGIDYYILDASKISSDTAHIVALDFYVKSQAVSFKFLVVQTQDNFEINDNLSWEFTSRNSTEFIKTPTNNVTYPALTLHTPSGTDINPIFIKFKFLGKDYLVYNIGGKFYNSFNNQELSFTDNKMLFNQSGTYTVEIYDNTHLTLEDGNHYKYDFNIKNNTISDYSVFYIHALCNNNIVTDEQIANDNIVVNFVNINDIINQLDRIIITKSWNPTGGEFLSKETIYQNNFPQSLTFTEDGTYNIQVITKDGTIINQFDFVLIKEIKTYFEQKDGHRYEIGKNEKNNTSRTFYITETIDSSYGEIESTTTYTFKITVAKSAPTINGIKNNQRTQNKVNLTVEGVGHINVSVTQDGKTSTLHYTNSGKLPSLTEPGKYFIKITDQMGTTVTKSFTITLKMNTASLVLIIIAAITLITFIVTIIVSRTKIKVR